MTSLENLPSEDIGTDDIQVHSNGSDGMIQYMPSLLMNAARTAGMGPDVRDTALFETNVDRDQGLVRVRVTATQEVRQKFLKTLVTYGFTISSPGQPKLLVFPTADQSSSLDLEEAM